LLARLLDTPQKRIAVAIVGFVLLVGAVAAFALGGDDEEAAPTTTTTTTTTAPTTTVPAPVAPLTGLPGDSRLIGRPALVVKIDNGDRRARPQVGLNAADVVYEERVEGSVTRFVAVYHSTDSTPVGPVRSARTSDIAILNTLHRPFYAWSGANPAFADRVRGAAIKDVGYDVLSGEYFREPSRPRPENLMLKSTATIMAMPSPGASPPPALFTYRKDPKATPRHWEPLQGVHIVYGGSAGSAPVDYRWDGKGWARFQNGTPHVENGGQQVAPENVIIQFVNYAPTDVVDQFGVPIPEAQLVGQGEAWILTAGGIVKGGWVKGATDEVTRYINTDGEPIELTPGNTWVALPPPGGATRL
jgi:hypothetical protein